MEREIRITDGTLETSGSSSPLLTIKARRKFVSARGPRIKPRIIGVMGNSSLFIIIPIMPKIKTIHASKIRLFTAIAPTRERTIIIGKRMCFGTASMRTNSLMP